MYYKVKKSSLCVSFLDNKNIRVCLEIYFSKWNNCPFLKIYIEKSDFFCLCTLLIFRGKLIKLKFDELKRFASK